MINRVRGMQDFLDMRLFEYVVQTVQAHLERQNFKSIATPIIESAELFRRSLGQHTDAVGKEMFVLESRTDDSESQLCLRPEMTASVVRAFIEHSVEVRPWRVFSWGPVFRYERPQKGRYRQFHQFNIEVIGAQSIGYDAQLLALLDTLFKKGFLLSDYRLDINFLGCMQDRTGFKQVLQQFLTQHAADICQTCLVRKDANVLRIFDCKSPTCQKRYVDAPKLVDSLCGVCQAEWTMLQRLLTELSVTFQINHRLVRGLDYYNKTCFEFSSENLGAQTAFCGGGRYDDLIGQLSPKHAAPAVGAGIGIERLMLLLESQFDKKDEKLLVGCIAFENEQVADILKAAQALVAAGLSVELLLDGSLKSSFKRADKLGCSHVLVVGPEEQAEQKAMVKDMKTGQQMFLQLNDGELVGYFLAK
ncbi:histidine--tRNA ligase [bacterium]|nr:MAG: histidine--tRNA ligase [bacterium]QQR61419.1 MAG: histidine--tRNA ligase [bacterium]QQR63060.1 MAG: histidine--tRNA ligase [bacterium]